MRGRKNGRGKSGKRVNMGPGDKARNHKERHRDVRKKRKRKSRAVGREKAKTCSLRNEKREGETEKMRVWEKGKKTLRE